MDDPVQDIGPVVHSLTQGNPREQKQTLERYFTQDAAFYHPFCRVDSFPGSRDRVLDIFRWYKILSPKIELDIQSVAYDEVKLILYVTIHQIFSVWFLFGLHSSNVVLTTKLQLEKKADNKYYIKSQNDLYQSDQVVKFFTLPWGAGVYFVYLWQYFSTIACVILAHAFGFLTIGLQYWADHGKEQVEQARRKRLDENMVDAKEIAIAATDKTIQKLSVQANGGAETASKPQQFGNMKVISSK